MTTLSNLVVEPTYDAKRLLTDEEYKFDMVDNFKSYISTIELYENRVRYFMKICNALNLPLATITHGGGQIPNRAYHNYDGFIFTDVYGEKIDVLFRSWERPQYTSNVERATMHRIYFMEYYRHYKRSFLGFEMKLLGKLEGDYSSKILIHSNPESFKQSELNTSQRIIDLYQQKINEWVSANQDIKDKRLLNQFLEASRLVEDEINGSEAITWELLIRTDYLQPFALLWDITAYKLFLNREIKHTQPAYSLINTVTEKPSPRTKSSTNKLESSLCLAEIQPQLYIPSKMKTRLFKTLSIYVVTEQQEMLELLLTNGFSGNRIWVKLRADSFGFIFKQALGSRENQLGGSMKEIARWLSAYFSYGEINSKHVSVATTYKVLRGNTDVEKDNQIRLKY